VALSARRQAGASSKEPGVSVDLSTLAMSPASAIWWAASHDGSRDYVCPRRVLRRRGDHVRVELRDPPTDDGDAHRVRRARLECSRGEYGEQIAKAIKHASGGHRGEVVA
jgi:hypothetical protein